MPNKPSAFWMTALNRIDRSPTSACFAWPLIPYSVLLRFVHALFLQKGVLDGLAGVLYAAMQATYQFMIGMKVVELRRRRCGLPV